MEKVPMRRFECQVRDPELISAMLDMIDTVHIGLFDEEYPYVVPVNFGFDIQDGKLLIYIHTAREGKKLQLWSKNPKVAATFDVFYNHPDRRWKGRIHDYRCVMAKGVIRKIDPRAGEVELFQRAFQRLLEHYNRGPKQYNGPHCRWSDLYVIECNMENVTAKVEYPVSKVEEVPFVDVYSETYDPDADTGIDYNELFSKKYHISKEFH